MADKLPAALSGGQQQIAAIARALANDPPILVADEPTGNLDSQSEKLILDIFEHLAARGKTILIVTHDPILVRRSTRRVLISDGELVNEHVAQALAMLPHNQLLRITILAAGAQLRGGRGHGPPGRLGQRVDRHHPGHGGGAASSRVSATRPGHQLGPGEYVSEFEMLERKPAI